MKRLFSLCLAGFLLLGCMPASGLSFSDVKEDLWCYNEISDLTDEGVIGGYADGSYRPSGSVTYGAALKLVLLAAGASEQEPTEEDSVFSGYYAYALKKGYTDKVSDLSAPADRLYVARLVARTLHIPESEEASPYADTKDAYATALYFTGIMQGSNRNGKRVLKADTGINRAEMAAVVWRIGHTKWRRIFAENTGTAVCNGSIYALDSSLPRSSIAADDLAWNDGFLTYPKARIGIDVSSYQEEIDWEAVAEAGVEFAIVRVGYRGYGEEGTLNEDTYYLQNILGAQQAGLTVGVYLFSQALNIDEAMEEAAFLLDRIDGLDIDGPVVFDWERITSVSSSRSKNVNKKTLTECAAVFCEMVKHSGYEPYIYFNQTLAYGSLALDELTDYGWWLAEYNDDPNFYYDCQMWQYSDSGSVPGISGRRTDLDLWF